MAAVPTNKNDERRSLKPQKMKAYMELAHIVENVWDKMATCWAGKEDWMIDCEKEAKFV